MDKKKIGIFPGGFNLLHAGHLVALEKAKQQCDYLMVILVRDQSIRGHKMYQEPIEDRYLKVKAVKWVDEVMPCEDETSLLDLMRLLDYDLYFLSEEYRMFGFDEGKSIAGDKMFFLPRKHKWSTTNEVTKIERVLEEDKSTDVSDNRTKAQIGGIVQQGENPILIGGDTTHYSPAGREGVSLDSSDPSLQVQLPEDR